MNRDPHCNMTVLWDCCDCVCIMLSAVNLPNEIFILQPLQHPPPPQFSWGADKIIVHIYSNAFMLSKMGKMVKILSKFNIELSIQRMYLG